MVAKQALILMYDTLRQLIDTHPPHETYMIQMQSLLQKMLFISVMGDTFVDNAEARLKLARHIIETRQPYVLQSGYFHHAFYIEIRPVSGTQTQIIVHNFNLMARKFNRQVEPGENYFYPYVLVLNGGAESVSEYIRVAMISRTHAGNQMRQQKKFQSASVRNPRMLEYEKEILDQFCRTRLFDRRDAILNQVLPQIQGADGNADIGRLAALMQEKPFEAVMRTVFADLFADRSFCELVWPLVKKNPYYVYEHFQKLIWVSLIYEPYRLHPEFSRHPQEEQFAPYGLQRTGNCTVFNMKAALYSALGLNTMREADRDTVQSLNQGLLVTAMRALRLTDPAIQAEILKSPAKAPELSPEGIEIIQNGFAHAQAGRYPEAKAQYETYIRNHPNSPLGHAQMAKLMDRQGKHKSAIYHYKEAIARAPYDFRLYMNLAIDYQQLGNIKRAAKNYKHAIELNPYDNTVYFNRGGWHGCQKKWQAAINDYTAAIIRAPSDARAHYQRGTCYAELKDYANAESDLKKALQMAPELTVAAKVLAVCAEQQRQYLAAVAWYTKYLLTEADDPESLMGRGTCHLQRQNWPAAIADFSRLIDLWVNHPSDLTRYGLACYRRGHCYRQLGRIPEARSDYDQSRRLGLNLPLQIPEIS